MKLNVILALGGALCLAAFAQQQPLKPGTPAPHIAPTSEDRVDWWAESTLGPTSWLTGGFSSGWSTIWNNPKEWKRSPEGFGRRLATRTANVSISNAIDAGFGAIWGEDPRYRRRGSGSFGSRAGYIIKMTFCTPYRDGRTRFAFARTLGNAGGNTIQNLWMPDSARGPEYIVYNMGVGFSARAGSNAFKEFWPDVRKLVFKK
ncbi:MAG TPA: hypothetical protein VGK29_03680 [Paludibaculum sp.]|jgi:hypothetical protein